jgi:hypothetical protein
MTQKERLVQLIIDSVNGCARNWAEVIADHLLANGVIVPPCKVGDMIFGVVPKYNIKEGRVKYEVDKIEIKDLAYMSCDRIWEVLFIVIDEKYEQFGTFGKTVFLTREEAEKALAERSKE